MNCYKFLFLFETKYIIICYDFYKYPVYKAWCYYRNILYCPVYRFPWIFINRLDISSIKHWTMKYETNNKSFRYIYIVVCVCLYWNVQDMINLNTKEVLCSHITLPLWPNISDVLFEFCRIKHLTLSINLSKQVKYFYCPNVSFYVTKGVHLIEFIVFLRNIPKEINNNLRFLWLN